MFRNRTVDAVAGRISRRRGRRCMTTGGAFTASTGNSCCGIGESFWNEASPTPMKTGGMRRVYLRGQANVLKRVLIHLGGFNLSLIMRRRFCKGTPRGWQGFSADALLMGLQFWIAILVRVAQESTSPQMLRSSPVVRVTIVVRFAAQ